MVKRLHYMDLGKVSNKVCQIVGRFLKVPSKLNVKGFCAKPHLGQNLILKIY